MSARRKSVLLIGDSFFISSRFANFLQREGFEIQSAGSEGIEFFTRVHLPAEITIVDFGMRFNDPCLVTSLIHYAMPESFIIALDPPGLHCNEYEATLAGAGKIMSQVTDESEFEESFHRAIEEYV